MDDFTSKEKIVEYGKYCHTCLYSNKREDEDPCDECLNEFTNTDTHRPVYYKKDPKKDGTI